MKWDIADNCRVDLIFYSGVGLAGQETVIRIFPSGKQGDVDHTFQSMRVGATKGLRVYLCTSTDDEHWQQFPWRCVRVVSGVGLKTETRRTLLNIHDLDQGQSPGDKSLKHGQDGFPEVDSPEDGEGWTFGKGAGKLKNRIRMIRVVKE